MTEFDFSRECHTLITWKKSEKRRLSFLGKEVEKRASMFGKELVCSTLIYGFLRDYLALFDSMDLLRMDQRY
jgi:hypothetical protein